MDTNFNQYLLDTFDEAMDREYIQVYYQPVIRTITGQVCGLEALARWIDPEKGMIQPIQFIGLLEEHRLIHRLDSYIIRQVCARIRRVMDQGEIALPVSVNLSRMDFELCDIYETVNRWVAEARIPRNYIPIEITESMFADKPEMMRTVINRFRQAGYQVWMDDFGSGYSSLNVLKDYNFDELKVDMGFLSTLHLRSRKILTSIIEMAKSTGLHSLVEGVETEAQYLFLRDIGCEKLQGYLFGRPAPYDDLLGSLRERGIEPEPPMLRAYYDQISTVNVLSSAPFMSKERRDNLENARQLNSIPLALLEIKDFHFTLLYCNTAFEDAVNETQWWRNAVDGKIIGAWYSAFILPERIHVLMDAAREQGNAELCFVSDGEYYEMEVMCVADAVERFTVLLSIQNLSRNKDFIRIGTLDSELRHVYSVFDSISKLDLEADVYTPLYTGPNDRVPSGVTVREAIDLFARQEVFPEDRDKFLAFYDMETLEERLLKSGRDHILDYSRARNRYGFYAWTQFVLVSCRAGVMLSLVRQADADVLVMQERFLTMHPVQSSKALTDGRLWKSLTQTDLLNLYWKDRKRRFVGASKGFLDYMGLSSVDQILNKTDEEIGWHVRVEHSINNDLETMRRGMVKKDRPLRFLVNGVNRNTLNSTAPVFNEYGGVVGMVGSLRDYDPVSDPAADTPDFDRKDGLTGLLNTRGLAEEVSVYCDMYYLREADFVRIHLGIEDFDSIVLQYGRKYGETLIASLGKALRRLFGSSAVLGRSRGHQFVILRQYSKPEDIPRLTSEIRSFASTLDAGDGIPGGVYLSVGMCAFSECRDIFRQEQLADVRQEEDHNRHVSELSGQKYEGSFFKMYDHLPLAFAVYEIKADQDTGAVEAFFYYVNARFAKEQEKTPEDLIGRSLHEIFPELEQKWYDIAYEAAFLSRETIEDNIFFHEMNTHYYLTASQIFRPGFCVFTYQPLDGPYAIGG